MSTLDTSTRTSTRHEALPPARPPTRTKTCATEARGHKTGQNKQTWPCHCPTNWLGCFAEPAGRVKESVRGCKGGTSELTGATWAHRDGLPTLERTTALLLHRRSRVTYLPTSTTNAENGLVGKVKNEMAAPDNRAERGLIGTTRQPGPNQERGCKGGKIKPRPPNQDRHSRSGRTCSRLASQPSVFQGGRSGSPLGNPTEPEDGPRSLTPTTAQTPDQREQDASNNERSCRLRAKPRAQAISLCLSSRLIHSPLSTPLFKHTHSLTHLLAPAAKHALWRGKSERSEPTGCRPAQ